MLYIGSVFGSLNAIQIGLWKYDQYAFVTPNLHLILTIFARILWFSWYLIFVVLSLNFDFDFDFFIKCNKFSLFFTWLFFSKMLIGQCYGKCWIIFWKLFKNVEVEHEWTLYTCTIYTLTLHMPIVVNAIGTKVLLHFFFP